MWEHGEMEESAEKVIISYELNLPEKLDKLQDLVNAEKYKESLYDISMVCRKLLKYHDDPSDELIRFAEEIQDLAGEWLVW